jgi:hypothetical protein
VAFEVALDDLLEAPKHLKAQGITPLSFFGLETTEDDWLTNICHQLTNRISLGVLITYKA